jgi:DNA-binding MarR family transcriptional regulator
MTQRRISDALRCSPRNVTGLLDGLERDGLVARNAHPTDRRATIVTLTDAGTRLLDRLGDEYDQSARRLFDGIPTRRLDTFVAVLDQILERVRHDDAAARP